VIAVWTCGRANAHSMLNDFGTVNVRSNPAAAGGVGRPAHAVASAASAAYAAASARRRASSWLRWASAETFDAVLAIVGITAAKIPPRSPRANAYAKRFVFTARTEVTDRMLIFDERHLQSVLAKYGQHYNGRRPHRGRQIHPPRPDHPVADFSQDKIKRRGRPRRLINEYERAAQKTSSSPEAEFWNPTAPQART
jgi:hypothetical protein